MKILTRDHSTSEEKEKKKDLGFLLTCHDLIPKSFLILFDFERGSGN